MTTLQNVKNKTRKTMKKIPKLLTKRQKTMKKTSKLLTRRQKTMKKIPKMLIPKPVSNAGELLVNPKSSVKVKRVAASRLGLESFLRRLRFLKSLQKLKRKKNKY